MKIVGSKEMKAIDSLTIKKFGLKSIVLMERAGLAVALRTRQLTKSKKILIICGGGNNGGDGLVCARLLHNWRFDVKVLFFSKLKFLSQDCKYQYSVAKRYGVQMRFNSIISDKDIEGAFVIDAVFGTGLNSDIKGKLRETFRFINKHSSTVLAVDIPSGISSDTGEILGESIKADYTVTFGLPKRGHYFLKGREYTGNLFIEDIGFPLQLTESERLRVGLLTIDIIKGLIPYRHNLSHKGDFGHILLVGGSRGKTGAVLMAAKSCIRSGAGLITIGVPDSLSDVFQKRVREEMVLLLPDNNGLLDKRATDKILDFISSKGDVIAIGPGMGVSKDIELLMKDLILKSPVPLIIDADGINAISGFIEVLKKAKSPIILTPHIGEMARLLGLDVNKKNIIENNKIDVALNFSKKTGVYLVLKGSPTVISTPQGKVFVNIGGNPGMATAGSGDVLTGIIAGLIGQGLNPEESSILGVYLHSLAGDIGGNFKGQHSLIASDIINYLPQAFLQIKSYMTHPLSLITENF